MLLIKTLRAKNEELYTSQIIISTISYNVSYMDQNKADDGKKLWILPSVLLRRSLHFEV